MPGITRKTFSSNQGVREWIVQGDWVFYEALKKNRARIQPNVVDAYSQACLFDSMSLAVASFESIVAFGQQARLDGRGCAWRMISIYYSAYFAANSIMRLSGYASTNLSAIECAEINEMASLTGFSGSADSHRMNQGLCFVRPSGSGGDQIAIDMMAGGGGVHIQFWVCFKRFLEDLRMVIRASPRVKHERDQAEKELVLLSNSLSFGSSTNGSWLSEIRNSVNYRFGFGSWYPYDGSKVRIEDITGVIRSALRDADSSLPDPAADLPDLIRAARVSAALLYWLKDSLEIIGTTSAGRKKMLIQDGALEMMRAA